MARPEIQIDEKLVEKLASIHCTMNEIAAAVGCSVDTLERRFADTIKKGRDKGKSSLRRHMWEAAQKGNTAMLIWLSKQTLGMREPRDDLVDPPDTAAEDLHPAMTREQWKKLHEERQKKKCVP